MINDFLDNLGAHQYQKMHMDKETRKELEKVNDKLKGTIKEYLRCNSAGRQSRIITIEYDVKEDN